MINHNTAIQTNSLSYNTITEDNIKMSIVSSKVAYQKLDNNFAENITKKKIATKGKFAKKKILFSLMKILFVKV
jgi:hypothetical protein